ncbi:unnamed protein product [Trifolium pratense]|uniref:Uncharacterized protein n=1 Tax=Trifolium pratense TaxID=57577 RepID=A0ACB0JKG4_TRIPR|nr:unnamed protein product [Trifolium pratense]
MLKCWKDIPGYNAFVREKWNSFQVDGWGSYVLKDKFKMIKVALRDWHLAHAQNIPSRIDSLKVRLSALDEKGEEDGLSEAELTELHGISNATSVIQVDGVTMEGVTPIRQAVFSHFESHFKAPNVERPGVEDLQFKRLNQVEVGGLIKPFTEAEVKQAVWDCDSYKSPGPDGINFGFMKDFWVELKGDVMRFLVDFHRNGRLSKGINATFITLIPKTDSPQRLNDFRPISLVGSLYKILAKVLANRLRQVIGSVISESQTAFVKNRQILDGILIANEIVDEARKSKKDLMLFKVDFEKAYDSVDWGYLDDVMGRMSFPTLWRKWIRECVCTATASVLVNGSPTDEFPLRRGLQQGDPLSPFLFLLAAEGLNVLMEAMVAHNLFTGYSIGGQESIRVSHLQFADDTLLLGVKSWANVRALRAVLVLFKTMSGLKEYGGLGVRQLREFNLALLGKWCWRMLVDREGLWFRVLEARYGVEDGRLCEGGQRGSVWWREIVRIREGEGELGGRWFGEHVMRRVGDGSVTLFWIDPWLDGIQIALGRRDVCFRVGGRWRGVGVAEAIEGVGGGVVEGVSVVTS